MLPQAGVAARGQEKVGAGCESQSRAPSIAARQLALTLGMFSSFWEARRLWEFALPRMTEFPFFKKYILYFGVWRAKHFKELIFLKAVICLL